MPKLPLNASLVSRILADMHSDCSYTAEAIAEAHGASPSLVKEILERGVQDKALAYANNGEYYKVGKTRVKRKRTKQIDWIIEGE